MEVGEELSRQDTLTLRKAFKELYANPEYHAVPLHHLSAAQRLLQFLT